MKVEGIQEINTDKIINALKSEGIVILKKSDLEEMLSSIHLSNRVDNRKKYISHKEVIGMFGVTDYWLRNQREKEESLIVCIPGKHQNTAWKYQIQSFLPKYISHLYYPLLYVACEP